MLQSLPTRTLMKLDAAGALFTSGSLALVLPMFESYLGIPVSVLVGLGAFVFLYFVFDVASLVFNKGDLLGPLTVIACANLFYCVLSVGLAFVHWESVTALGWIYIVLEVVVIVAIALFELRAVARARGAMVQGLAR